ncbi:MAG TPA: hypothetical protein PLR22_11355, partial [Saprospiraceae bacterium]|nr:hypothetical protein [Saprospiraceae bacterium]
MKWDFIKGIYEPFIGIDSFCFAFTKKGIHHSGLLCSGISNENLCEMILLYGKCTAWGVYKDVERYTNKSVSERRWF